MVIYSRKKNKFVFGFTNVLCGVGKDTELRIKYLFNLIRKVVCMYLIMEVHPKFEIKT